MNIRRLGMTVNEKWISSLIVKWSVMARWTRCSPTWMPASSGNRRISNPSCCGRYRWCVSWNGTNASQAQTRMTISKPKVKTTALLLYLVKSVANCVHLINKWNTRNNVFKREKAFKFLVQPPKTKNLYTEDDPFTFVNFTVEGTPYDLMANIFRDLEDRRWPFEMMRNIWSRTWLTKLSMQQLKYANLTRVCVS